LETTDFPQPDSRGLDPAIYAFATHWIDAPEGVDHRVKLGDDDF